MIRKMALTSAAVTTVAGVIAQTGVQLGALAGSLDAPFDITASADGVQYIAECAEHVVLELR